MDLRALLSELGARAVTGLMVEGGAETLWGFFDERLVDRVGRLRRAADPGRRAARRAASAATGFRSAATPRLADVRVEATRGATSS